MGKIACCNYLEINSPGSFSSFSSCIGNRIPSSSFLLTSNQRKPMEDVTFVTLHLNTLTIDCAQRKAEITDAFITHPKWKTTRKMPNTQRLN